MLLETSSSREAIALAQSSELSTTSNPQCKPSWRDYIDDRNNNRLDDRLEPINQAAQDTGPFTFLFSSDKSLGTSIETIEILGGFVLRVLESPYQDASNRVIVECSPSVLPDMAFTLRDLLVISEVPQVIPTLYHAGLQIGANPHVWTEYGFKGDPTMSIAIVDGTGIDRSHSAFVGKSVTALDFTTNPPGALTTDLLGHGTKVAMAAVGTPFNTTDDKDRVIVSGSEAFDGTGLGLEVRNYSLTLGGVNVTKPGEILFNITWTNKTGWTAGLNNFSITAPNGTSFYGIAPKNTPTTLPITILPGDIGIYTVQANFRVWDLAKPAFNLTYSIHYPFNFTGIPEGPWSGIAPDCRLVYLKAVNALQVEDAMDWIIENKRDYNIAVASFSFKFSDPEPGVMAKTQNLVERGIVVVAAAGNDGPGNNYAGAADAVPASADLAISVGAIGWDDRVTSYSSQGGPSPTGYTLKPDVVAPGGEYSLNNSDYLPLITAETNAAELFGTWGDQAGNDSTFAVGTSYSAPLTAGGVLLLIQALGGTNAWQFTKQQALDVKNLLLMTASETGPAPRLKLTDSKFAPTLDRGAKDVHEGYGRINIGAAIDAIANHIDQNASVSVNLTSSTSSSTGKHCWASRVTFTRGYYYNIDLGLPDLADYDLYLYEPVPNAFGEPNIYAKSTRLFIDLNESLSHLFVNETKDLYLVVKAVEGAGNFTLKFEKILDQSPPNQCIIENLIEGMILGKQKEVKYNATDQDTGILAVQIWEQVDSANPRLLNETQFTPNQTVWWDTRLTTSGSKLIFLRALDYAGNSLNSSAISLVVDNAPPEYIFFELDGNSKRVYGKVEGSCRFFDALSGIRSIQLTSFGRSSPIFNRSVQPGDLTLEFEWLTSEESDGFLELYVIAIDALGNANQSKAMVVIIDNMGFQSRVLLNVGIALSITMPIAVYVFHKWVGLPMLEWWDRFSEKVRGLIRDPSYYLLHRRLRDFVPRRPIGRTIKISRE